MKKIMLCCNAGMSTSLLVQKMQNDAKTRGLDVEIEARPLNEAMDKIGEADVVLLGPQIGYTKGDFEKATDKPVEVIPMIDYGRMNATGINDFACKLMGE
ncbi:PTS sugar transporter subunit IIB [Paratractidigestivibacter sp.]|uniref:PTS sugar transporter subunit IIB n=1 Tax=Paratractidigestivibacter sp. TaxID=2847316 RepID=UPI002ABD89E7|nr:PTS sugar transporter subunit IIB [Paratractidigestivibacter sp.]